MIELENSDSDYIFDPKEEGVVNDIDGENEASSESKEEIEDNERETSK